MPKNFQPCKSVYNAKIELAEGTTTTKMNTSKPIKKLKWDKLDKSAYIRSLERELAKAEHTEPASVERRLNRLTTVKHKATDTAVPPAIIKLKGQKWKASPKVRKQLKICKQMYKLWLASGKMKIF